MNLDYIKLFNLTTNNISPAKGRILISEPFAQSEIFKRSIVLLTEYSSQKGAMGFILNKKIPFEEINSKIVEEFEDKEINLSIGGPVEIDKLFYIYKTESEIIEDNIEILPNIYFGGNYQQLKQAVLNNLIPEKNLRFFLGYSGWAPGQLENEISENYWLVKKINSAEIFTFDKNMWENQINQLENKYKIWTIVPENPTLN